MSKVTISTDGFVVDAEIVGAAFNFAPADVPAKLRAGEITSRCETGVDDDVGRWRLTFYSGGRALRLIVDEAGTILSCHGMRHYVNDHLSNLRQDDGFSNVVSEMDRMDIMGHTPGSVNAATYRCAEKPLDPLHHAISTLPRMF